MKLRGPEQLSNRYLMLTLLFDFAFNGRKISVLLYVPTLSVTG